MAFSYLHIHTHYSCDDSIVKIPELFEKASELGLAGLAITDRSVMSGVPEFLSCSRRYPRIKPVVGCEYNLDLPGHEDVPLRVVLLAKNRTGYLNLIKLSSIANEHGEGIHARISHELLEQYHEGLICLSDGLEGEVSNAIRVSGIIEARRVATWYKDIFGEDFYLEVSLHKPEPKKSGNEFLFWASFDENYQEEKKVFPRLQKLGTELGIKMVASNPVLFLNRDDAFAHDAFYYHRTGNMITDKFRFGFSHLEYLRSEDEMRKLFVKYPDALDNTMDILNKIERYDINRSISLPQISDNPEIELRNAVYNGAQIRYGNVTEPLKERIEYELSTISRIGFDSYFLIIKEMIDWVRNNQHVVGPGRGSAVGSVVNYCLGITDVDPLKYGLLFERFLNPDRIQLPDIDTDFDAAGLYSVDKHLRDRYGEKNVAHVICFHTNSGADAFEISAKAYDVQDEEISKFKAELPSWSTRGLEEELANNRKLQRVYKNGSHTLQEAVNSAKRLEGVISHAGMHACANLVSSLPLTDCIPMMTATMYHDSSKDDERVVPLSQYEVSWVEDAGVLKIDNLGLLILDYIHETESAIKKKHGIEINLRNIPLDDTATYELFQSGDTGNVFQFESDGMRKWLGIVHPESFSQLIAMNAMYRPGPMDFLPDYALRKNGMEPVDYILPETESILAETYGLFLYQEQIMITAQRIAKFCPGASAKLIRVIGVRTPDSYHLAESYKERFIEGGAGNGYDHKSLEKLWEEMEQSGPYAFNKSHAVAYTWLSYQTAWLKAHYPDEYLQAVDKVNKDIC